jgi:hypothetical protein
MEVLWPCHANSLSGKNIILYQVRMSLRLLADRKRLSTPQACAIESMSSILTPIGKGHALFLEL